MSDTPKDEKSAFALMRAARARKQAEEGATAHREIADAENKRDENTVRLRALRMERDRVDAEVKALANVKPTRPAATRKTSPAAKATAAPKAAAKPRAVKQAAKASV